MFIRPARSIAAEALAAGFSRFDCKRLGLPTWEGSSHAKIFVDHLGRATHDRFVQRDGALTRSRAGIEAALRAGLGVKVSVVAFEGNAAELPEITWQPSDIDPSALASIWWPKHTPSTGILRWTTASRTNAASAGIHG